MIFDWYKIFNLSAFLQANLVSRTYTLDLEDRGLQSFLVTNGNVVSVTFDGVILSIGMADANPFIFDNRAIFLDSDTQDVYVGYPNEG